VNEPSVTSAGITFPGFHFTDPRLSECGGPARSRKADDAVARKTYDCEPCRPRVSAVRPSSSSEPWWRRPPRKCRCGESLAVRLVKEPAHGTIELEARALGRRCRRDDLRAYASDRLVPTTRCSCRLRQEFCGVGLHLDAPANGIVDAAEPGSRLARKSARWRVSLSSTASRPWAGRSPTLDARRQQHGLTGRVGVDSSGLSVGVLHSGHHRIGERRPPARLLPLRHPSPRRTPTRVLPSRTCRPVCDGSKSRRSIRLGGRSHVPCSEAFLPFGSSTPRPPELLRK
jgi:hypothetical protein